MIWLNVCEARGVTVNCIRVPNVQIDEGRYEYLTGWRRKTYEIKRRQAITPAQMAEAYVRLVLAPEFETVTGQYFDEHCREVRAYKPACDQTVWAKLWNVSVAMTNLSATRTSLSAND